MRLPIELKHESGYYWGLGLLLASCLSLGWALWRDAFTPEVFLAGLVAFSWGYLMLWRHDVNIRFAACAAEAAELRARIDIPSDEAEPLIWVQELPEVIQPPDPCETTNDAPCVTPSAIRDEAEAQDPAEF